MEEKKEFIKTDIVDLKEINIVEKNSNLSDLEYDEELDKFAEEFIKAGNKQLGFLFKLFNGI